MWAWECVRVGLGWKRRCWRFKWPWTSAQLNFRKLKGWNICGLAGLSCLCLLYVLFFSCLAPYPGHQAGRRGMFSDLHRAWSPWRGGLPPGTHPSSSLRPNCPFGSWSSGSAGQGGRRLVGGRTGRGCWLLTAWPTSTGLGELGKAARQNMVRREADSSSRWCRAVALLLSSWMPSLPITWEGGSSHGHPCGWEHRPRLPLWARYGHRLGLNLWDFFLT